MTERDWLQPFEYHQPTYEVAQAMGVLRARFRDLARAVLAACPDSRERSLAITALEEASMRSIQSLAIHSPGSKREASDGHS